ncbi:CD209 antigen-like protein E [Cyprinus carpio]|uniref:CD209 antigen-like protein E n=1 Tax=Cyprinus carpio TaxID=7962 RepID=A0A9Q9VXV5_CYPCA|nr:CD209 antigen-like protein E [Cyprinus carpio]
MDLEAIYENVERRDIQKTTGPQTQSQSQDEGKDLKHRGSRCLVLITVGLGLICVLLLVFIILQHNTITAERDLIKSYKNTAEEFNQTINSLQDNYTDLMTEKHQLQNNFNSLTQKNLELETKVNNLTAEKDQLQRDFKSLNEKNVSGWFFMSTELKNWSDSRQYCRERGADLVIINTEEKQRHISSFTKERVWIGLSDRENEGIMKWVDNSPLKQGFWLKGEPNDQNANEDCIELMPSNPVLNNWNDLPCSAKRNVFCEK